MAAWAQAPAIDNTYKKEIEKLAKSKPVLAAFKEIENLGPQGMRDLVTLNEIEAPPFKEEKRAKIFLQMLVGAGADSAWIDEEGNALALRKGKKGNKTVALDAHLDTVFPEGTDVTVKYRGDTLYAPGIGDDTRGLVVVLTALRAISNTKIRTDADLLFIGSVGEEGLGDLRGVKHIFEDDGKKIDSWISIDGGSTDRVNHRGLGSYRYRVTFTGPGGHSWGSFGMVNPHHALGKAIDIFSEAALRYTSNGPSTSFNVGRIGGGTSVNSIPFSSWMEVDMRSVSPARLEGIDSVFKASMQQALESYNSKLDGPDLSLTMEMIGNRPSGEAPPETALVQRGMAASAFFGNTPRLTIGSTNANIPISKGIPAITIGRGGKGGGAHSLNEWWLNDNGDEAVKMALLILLAEAKLER